MLALSALYLVFVAHYSLNVLALDDWVTVPLVHAALHGHLTWDQLWTQHNENRMLVPNVFFVVIGVATRENMQVTMFVSAAVLIAGFACFLVPLRAYLGYLSGWVVLATGVVWFSLTDWESALWAIQLAWYLFLAAFVVMLALLLIKEARWTLGAAVVCAVLASYSSIQGLLLWPLGLVCLLWVRPSRNRVAVWVSAAAVTTVVYFVGYRSTAPSPDNLFPSTLFGLNSSAGSPAYALTHPLITARFLLVMVGDGLPIRQSAWVATLVGAIVLVAAIYVVVRGVRERERRVDCLPVVLIGFGLLFDLFVGLGRVKFGLADGAFVSRYSMGGLATLVGLITYALAHFEWRRVAIVGLVAFLAIQVGFSAHYGIEQSVAYRQTLDDEARLVTIKDPPTGCAGLDGFFYYHLPPNLTPSFVDAMKADQLNVFAPGPFGHYRAEGLPPLAPCRL